MASSILPRGILGCFILDKPLKPKRNEKSKGITLQRCYKSKGITFNTKEK